MNLIDEQFKDEDCGCSQETAQETPDSNTCVPYNTGACKTWAKASCTFWDGDAYPSLGITKGMPMTALVLNLLNRIQTLEAQV